MHLFSVDIQGFVYFQVVYAIKSFKKSLFFASNKLGYEAP